MATVLSHETLHRLLDDLGAPRIQGGNWQWRIKQIAKARDRNERGLRAAEAFIEALGDLAEKNRDANPDARRPSAERG